MTQRTKSRHLSAEQQTHLALWKQLSPSARSVVRRLAKAGDVSVIRKTHEELCAWRLATAVGKRVLALNEQGRVFVDGLIAAGIMRG